MSKQVTVKTFTVEGTYPFPVDMLRYDQCWPSREATDSVELAEAMSGTSDRIHRRNNPDHKPRKRRVTLVTNAINRPTVGRWESFGWKVVSE